MHCLSALGSDEYDAMVDCLAGEKKTQREACSTAILSTTNLAHHLGLNQGLQNEKPVSNHRNTGMTSLILKHYLCCLWILCAHIHVLFWGRGHELHKQNTYGEFSLSVSLISKTTLHNSIKFGIGALHYTLLCKFNFGVYQPFI